MLLKSLSSALHKALCQYRTCRAGMTRFNILTASRRYVTLGRTAKRLFLYWVFSRCRGNVSTELFPSNGCCSVAGLHSCYCMSQYGINNNTAWSNSHLRFSPVPVCYQSTRRFPVLKSSNTRSSTFISCLRSGKFLIAVFGFVFLCRSINFVNDEPIEQNHETNYIQLQDIGRNAIKIFPQLYVILSAPSVPNIKI
jgi:hypothetical protein